MQFSTIPAIVLAAAFSLVAAAPLPADVPALNPQEVSGNSTELLSPRGPTHHGIATWYGQQSMGACGRWHKNSDMIIAISGQHYRQSMCGRRVAVTHAGKTIIATVADECPECPSGNLDISRGMFARWADLGVGELAISWHFI
ncbi:hypothetical protein OC846_006212 [Tilletia horrida]|uniref:RlpA-like protein double-psi beta-barrel domain-containing protein n=1 Tax=Tilletia horrida TaxID=155126 RepID=A0AAN6GP39_9BASI|nr:hypothetical protein OC846_006212 [Tilletia horrida]KAK0546859.1 hypothetical protein OC845_004386 [Tilletia horrida]KAK0565758.1 hypothetical protein OC861_003579 [Tilletia horrida]